MDRPLRLRLFLLSLLVLSLASCRREPRADPPDGNLVLLLPESSEPGKLTVDGRDFTEPRGTERKLTVQPADDRKTVTVVFSFWPNNYTNIIRTKIVTLDKDKAVKADLTKEDPQLPDQIKPIYVPTPYDVVEEMCKLGKVSNGDVVYDIGCGDGRLVIMAVEKFGAAKGIGIDIDPERIEDCLRNANKAGIAERTEFRVADAQKISDLSVASVVLLYLGDHLNMKLRPILQKTLKPGARVLSHRFKMGDWTPDETKKFKAKDGDDYEIHRWTITDGKK